MYILLGLNNTVLDTLVNFYHLKQEIDSFQMDPQIPLGLQKMTLITYFGNLSFLQFEQERGHVVSGIECYMKQYGVSKQEVQDEFRKQIVNAWKDINKECIRPTEVPVSLVTRVVNLARVMDLLYKDEDAYTHLGGVMVEGVTSMLVDPVPV